MSVLHNIFWDSYWTELRSKMKCLVCACDFEFNNNCIKQKITKDGEDNGLVEDLCEGEELLMDELNKAWSVFCLYFHVAKAADFNCIYDYVKSTSASYSSSSSLSTSPTTCFHSHQLPFCLPCHQKVNNLAQLHEQLQFIRTEIGNVTTEISSAILGTTASNDLSRFVVNDIDKITPVINQRVRDIKDEIFLQSKAKKEDDGPNDSSGSGHGGLTLDKRTISNIVKEITYRSCGRELHNSSSSSISKFNPTQRDRQKLAYNSPEPKVKRSRGNNDPPPRQVFKIPDKFPKQVVKKDESSRIWSFKGKYDFEDVTEPNESPCFICLTCQSGFRFWSKIIDHCRDVHSDPPNCECKAEFLHRHKLATHLKLKACWSGKQMDRWTEISGPKEQTQFLYDNKWPILLVMDRLDLKWTDPDARFRCLSCGFETVKRQLMTSHMENIHIRSSKSKSSGSSSSTLSPSYGKFVVEDVGSNRNVTVAIQPYQKQEPQSKPKQVQKIQRNSRLKQNNTSRRSYENDDDEEMMNAVNFVDVQIKEEPEDEVALSPGQVEVKIEVDDDNVNLNYFDEDET